MLACGYRPTSGSTLLGGLRSAATCTNAGPHSGERKIHGKDGVAGSIPAGGSTQNGRSGKVLYPACRIPRAANRHLPENCQSDLYAVRRRAPPAHATPRRPSPARPTGHAGSCRAPSAPAWAPRRAPTASARSGPGRWSAVGGDHQRQCVQPGVDPQRRRLQAGGRGRAGLGQHRAEARGAPMQAARVEPP